MNPKIPTYLREPRPSLEFAAHQKRGGKPYSEGHRRCYLGPIELLKGQGLPKLDILEVGTGIGYGMEQMVNAGFVGHYYGVEPDNESYRCSLAQSQRFETATTLFNAPFQELVKDFERLPVCDFSFCIEVIEHLPAQLVPEFLAGLRERMKHTLFLSTPDGESSNHGVAAASEWKRVLRANGFDVVAVKRQWTTLFVCEVAGGDSGIPHFGALPGQNAVAVHEQTIGGEK